MAVTNAISLATDRLFDAVERGAATYRATHTGSPLRTERVPQLAPVVPAVWLGLPNVAYAAPFFQTAWTITVAVDGDQPLQADTLWEIVGHVWDEVARADGFNPENVFPDTITVSGTEGNQSVLAAQIAVGHSIGARTLCPPEMADATP